ncbi:MAG: class I SAM-dependent methyltransferase [Patescibacteria group bacterium]
MKKPLHIGPVTTCQVCSSSRLISILSLGHQPIVQEYLTKADLSGLEETYPLELVRCRKCGLVQLSYIVDPRKVFPRQYPYRTGLTNMLIRNFESLAGGLEDEKAYTAGGLVVDIGSNDGTLLKPFKARGARVVGVEPTDAAKSANKNGIPTYQEYFSSSTVKKIKKKYGTAKVVTATNVFAHINDTASLVQNVKSLMGPKSVFVSESQYLMDIVEKLEFDTVYHEHLRFYSLKTITYLLNKHGLSVIDAEHISAAGGSIRVYAKKGTHPMSARAKKLLARETTAGINDEKKLLAFSKKVYQAKYDLVSTLLALKKSGKRIVGLTSSARSNTLLGFCNIDDSILDYACEKKGSPKIGMYTPGTHVPVVDESRLFAEQPEYALVLSWHIGTELVALMKKLGYKGKFILPLPKTKVI